MPHLILELVLWMLLVFFVGCIIGCILHRLFAGEEAAASRDFPPDAQQVVAPVVEATPPPVSPPAEAAVVGPPERPTGIAAARGGEPDNLQRISGIGPVYERTLHNLGFFHFDQIAGWTAEEVAWVDDHLKFSGRIVREEWTTQARLLSEGKEEEFDRRFGPDRAPRS
jgi:predicted flap endonuclease-1-like 5' DNA nuclease